MGGIGETVDAPAIDPAAAARLAHARCDARFEAIFGDEGIEEVRRLLARNLRRWLPVMRAIGVREIAAFLRGALSREQALAAGRIATRQYAKRQYTWFRRQPPPTGRASKRCWRAGRSRGR
jgi:tRNA dimethylallyltransferase